MTVPLTLRRLESDVDRPDFDCGDSDLNEFFAVDSKVSSNELMSVTYVAEHDGRVVVFFSVSNDSIKKADVHGSLLKRMLKHIPGPKCYSSMPAVKIGRFATSKDNQGHGYGTEILDFIKVWFTDGNKTGCRFIIVDAYNTPKTINFYKRNDFEFLTKKSDTQEETRLMYFDLIKFRE